MPNIKPFYPLSQSGADELMELAAKLDPPGGLLRIYDAETGSVVTVVVDKRGGGVSYAQWVIHGPVSREEAAQLLAEDALPPVGSQLQ